MEYELVIGLETHFELSAKSKIFCSCKVKYGGAPNSACCPVCAGAPGALPTLNKTVVDYAVMAGIALNCKISEFSRLERKNYIYPDLPKAYQISQTKAPLCRDGFFTLESGKKIRINQIHIEEDAGKLVYDGDNICADYNRAGVPLIEIVTEPDFSSVAEVKEYLTMLRLTMKYLGISDCKMQEGSMRSDVNISCRRTGESTLGERTEIKNMNSFSFMSKAIEYEFERQKNILNSGNAVKRQTLRYDERTSETRPMRSKETTDDYRYFNDPDFPPIYVSEKQTEFLRKKIPQLPAEKAALYKSYGAGVTEIEQLLEYPKAAEYFEKAVSLTGDAKLCAKFMLSTIFAFLKSSEQREKFDIKLTCNDFAKIIKKFSTGEVTAGTAKSVALDILCGNKTAEAALEFKKISKTELENIASKAVEQNFKAAADYAGGKEKALFALIGAVMRETKGRANPDEVKDALIRIIQSDDN